VRAYRFVRPNGPSVVVAWAVKEPVEVALPWRGPKAVLTNRQGQSQGLPVTADGTVRLRLTGSPVFITE
jgi:hypothetical protein